MQFICMRSSRAQRGSCQCNRSRWWGADNHHRDDGVSRQQLYPSRLYDCPTNVAEGQPGTQSADYATMGSRGEHFTQAQFAGAVMPALHSTDNGHKAGLMPVVMSERGRENTGGSSRQRRAPGNSARTADAGGPTGRAHVHTGCRLQLCRTNESQAKANANVETTCTIIATTVG
jgi:hypothetical protein